MIDVPRYSSLPFPPYSYVPGSKTPHPVSNPCGHMYGLRHAVPSPLDPLNWQESEAYRYGVDLFNHGFYWEAHEAWESLWHAAGHRGTVADFLKGLIKLAAAGVKYREGNFVGVRRHLVRAQELLRSVNQTSYCGADLQFITSLISGIDEQFSDQFPLKIELSPPPP